MAVVRRRIDTRNAQKHVFSADFLAVESLELRSGTWVLLDDGKVCDFLLSPDLVLFAQLRLFRTRYSLLHFVLFFFVGSFGFRHVLLSDFGLYFSKRLGDLFGLIILTSDTSGVEYTAFVRVLYHFHFFFLPSNELLEGHDVIEVEHFILLVFKLFQKL